MRHLPAAALWAPIVPAAALAAPLGGGPGGGGPGGAPFQRIASFPVFLNTSVDEDAAAEIVAASPDGNTLVYTDGETEALGFVDITDPANPTAAGIVGVVVVMVA